MDLSGKTGGDWNLTAWKAYVDTSKSLAGFKTVAAVLYTFVFSSPLIFLVFVFFYITVVFFIQYFISLIH